jgi:hypothetical protein
MVRDSLKQEHIAQATRAQLRLSFQCVLITAPGHSRWFRSHYAYVHHHTETRDALMNLPVVSAVDETASLSTGWRTVVSVIVGTCSDMIVTAQ